MQLKKNLNLLEVFAITSGAMFSAGLFLLPGLAYAKAGPAVFLSYLLAGLLAITGMLSQAELSTAMPKSGGTYYFVTRTMGMAVGTIYGLITMLALVLKGAFALIGMATFTKIAYEGLFQSSFGLFYIKVIAAVICLIILAINITGSKGAGRMQVFLIFITLPALLVYIFTGFPSVNLSHFQPFLSKGSFAVFSTAGFVFVSYGGLLKVASIAEEVKNPGKVLPLAMILSTIVVISVYILVIFVTIGVLDPSGLTTSLTPISDGAFKFLGIGGMIALSAVAVLAFTSAANAGIMGASRYPMALSRDNLLPAFLSDINKKFHTPHYSLLLIGLIMCAAVFMDLDSIIKSASTVLILTYIFSSLANIIMRESKLQNYQPKFIAPLYPWMQIIAILGCSFLLFEIGKQAIITSIISIASGLIVYLIYGRTKTKKVFALMHLIERITSKELTDHSLETELKEVLRERDDITKDRFDHLIEACHVIDIEGPMNAEEFFRKASEAMAENLKIKPKLLFKLLMERENQSCTALTDCLAIPHIVIKGEHRFDIFLARSKEGIYFSESAPKVHAVVVLAGTKDERNFHLKALSAIAQIIQDPKFEDKWLKAKNCESLRDLILLGERRR